MTGIVYHAPAEKARENGENPGLFNNLNILNLADTEQRHGTQTRFYKYGRFIEHEFKFVGKFGAKGEKRAEKKKATPEQVKKQNQYNREKKILRKIRCNFKPGDLWLTMKFPKGIRMPVKEIKGVRKSFFDTVRNKYKKRGQILKFYTGQKQGKEEEFISTS